MSAPKLSWYLLCVVFLYIETQGALGQKQAITKPASQGYGMSLSIACNFDTVSVQLRVLQIVECMKQSLSILKSEVACNFQLSQWKKSTYETGIIRDLARAKTSEFSFLTTW